jgi:hypothetical protein
MRAEVGDPAVLDDQQPIGVEARRFTLPSDMPPRILDEVEERSPDAERGLYATVSSRSARVKWSRDRAGYQATAARRSARPASGHAAAAPMSVMNSRRLT